MMQVEKPFLVEDRGLFIINKKYHGCWSPGDAMNQGVDSI